MDIAGPSPFGELPDDADGPGDEESVQRGWVEPDDRLWRHPSELSRSGFGAGSGRVSALETWRERRAAILAGTFGAAAVVAASAFVLVLLNKGSESANAPLKLTETSLVTPTVPQSVAQKVSMLRSSLVDLVPAGWHSSDAVTGVVMPGGELVVTSAAALVGASRVEVVTSDGRQVNGTVLAVDQSSGVAVVRTAGGLKPASFADEPVYPGELAVTACLHPGSERSAPSTSMAVGTVQDVASSAPVQGAPLLDAIEAETPMAAVKGGVLVNASGEVIGVLDEQKSAPGGRVGMFVPAALAEDVADELASTRHIDHGWIGVIAFDAPSYSGAAINTVFSGSPAASAGLEPGDVVTEVDGHRVLSHADLQARLYTMPPGSPIEVTVQRGGTVQTILLVLAPQADG